MYVMDLAAESCEEFYQDDVYQAIEDNRRVDSIIQCYDGQSIEWIELSDILSDKVVEGHEITPTGAVTVYFVNGDTMEVMPYE